MPDTISIKRSLWTIDNLYDRAKKIHSNRYVLFAICFVSFCIASFVYGITAEGGTVLSMLIHFGVPAISLAAILVGVYRADFALKWQCRLHPKVLKNTYPYLGKRVTDLAWELYGRVVPG